MGRKFLWRPRDRHRLLAVSHRLYTLLSYRNRLGYDSVYLGFRGPRALLLGTLTSPFDQAAALEAILYEYSICRVGSSRIRGGSSRSGTLMHRLTTARIAAAQPRHRSRRHCSCEGFAARKAYLAAGLTQRLPL